MLAKLIGFRMNYTREEIATSKKAVLTQWDEEIPANKKYKTRQK